MASRDVELLLKARDEASAKIAALQKRLKAFDEETKKSAANMRAAFQFGKVVAGVGIAEAGFKAITATTRLIKGDMEGTVQALKEIPAVGSAVSALEETLGEITGHLEEIRKLKEEAARIDAQTAAREKINDLIRGTNEALKYREKLAAAHTEAQREQIRLERALSVEIEKIQKALMDRNLSNSQREQAERTIQSLKAETARMVQEAYDKERQAIEANVQARVDAIREEQQALDQIEQQRLAAKRREAETLEDVESQIVQTRLEMMGRADLAQRKAIEDSFKRRIEEAERAGKLELAERLEELMALEIEQIKQQHREEERQKAIERRRKERHGTLKATESHYLSGTSGDMPKQQQAKASQIAQIQRVQRSLAAEPVEQQSTQKVERLAKDQSSKLDVLIKIGKKQTEILGKLARNRPKVASMGMV